MLLVDLEFHLKNTSGVNRQKIFSLKGCYENDGALRSWDNNRGLECMDS
jgi:hypothetical protein